MPSKDKISYNNMPAKALVLLENKSRHLDQADILLWLAKRNIIKNISKVISG